MTDRRNPVPQVLEVLSSDRLKDILRHWDDARAGRLMPSWDDIDLAAISRHLGIVWSWKYLRDTESFRGRFAGEQINEIFGKSLRGADMKEFFSDMEYELVFEKRRRVVMDPSIAVGTGHVFVHAHRTGGGERIILPLAENGLDGDGILGATVYEMRDQPPDTPDGKPVEKVRFFPL